MHEDQSFIGNETAQGGHKQSGAEVKWIEI